jgi:hypothetical protein
VSGGWHVLNHALYRGKDYREHEAERKRIERQKKKECPDMSGQVPDSSVSVSVSNSASELEGDARGGESGEQLPEPAAPPNPIPATPKRTRKQNGTPRLAGTTYPPDFEAAWIAFGRYGSKPDAARYWRALPEPDRAALVAAIPAYLRCVEAGRTKKQFEGWINPERRLWDMDWHAVHAEMTRPLAARPVERGSWTDNLGTGGL